MNIVSTKEINRALITQFFATQWGSAEMVISSGVYQGDELDGYAALDADEDIVGLITYVYREQELEIISLDSLNEGQGTGGQLLEMVEQEAKRLHCESVKLITTNDNLRALKFYQKRGYRLQTIYPDAVVEARKVKPQIPLHGYDDIPICDELLLVKKIRHHV